MTKLIYCTFCAWGACDGEVPESCPRCGQGPLEVQASGGEDKCANCGQEERAHRGADQTCPNSVFRRRSAQAA